MIMNNNKMELLSKKVTDCDFSVRALCCLRCAEIETVGDLAQQNKMDMFKYRNFGKKTFTELDDFLHDNGLDWGMTFG